MMHSKSFIRRLVPVPWLLAALVVGWTGAAEVVAEDDQTITLSIDVYEIDMPTVGKDGGKADVTITATLPGKAANEIRIGLDFRSRSNSNAQPSNALLTGTTKTELGRGYRLEGLADPLVIAEGETSGTKTISVYPVAGFTYAQYIYIGILDAYLQGSTGTVIHTETTFRLVAGFSFAARLFFEPDIHEISNESDEITITLRGYFDGENLLKGDGDRDLPFGDISSLAAIGQGSGNPGSPAFSHFLPGQLGRLFQRATAGTARDAESRVAQRDVDYTVISGFGQITIPHGLDKRTLERTVTIDPHSFNRDDYYPRYILLGVSKDTLASDNGVGGFSDSGVRLVPAIIKLVDSDVPKVKSLTEESTPIYENEGPQLLQVKVTLANPVSEATGINVRLHEVEGKGDRDRDYEMELREQLVIESGDSGFANILVTPNPDPAADDWRIKITAGIGDEAPSELEVKIVDAQTAISEIRLAASPGSVAETAGSADVTITAHVVGQPPAADINIPLTVVGGTATREVDYKAILGPLTIPAGALTAMQTITIRPVADNVNDGDAATNETILVGSTGADGKIKVGDADVTVTQATITLVDTPTPAPEPPAPPSLTFESANVSIMGTVGEALEAVLPMAMGADDIRYQVLDLPAGLSFDEASRTVSGTPEAAGETEISYFAVGGGNLSARLTGMVTIQNPLPPQVLVRSVAADIDLLRENAGHATTIRLTVTLAQAAAADETVMLSFAAPSAGGTATRDEHFEARWAVGPVITIPQGSTSGMAELTVTPIDNSRVGENAFAVRATTDTDSDGAKTDIVIADDESQSSAIVLSVDPASVSESSGSVAVEVTATLAGGSLDADATVTIGISAASSAVRDDDYSASFERGATQIAIPAGASSGSTTVTITPIPDDEEEAGEYIVLTGSAAGLATGSAVIALEDGGMMDDGMMDDEGEMMDDEEEMMMLAFDGEVADQAYTAGTAIAPLMLPEATGGEDVHYRVFGLPAGLSFDTDTRTISGTPEAATGGAVEITFLAEDSTGAGVTLTFNITVNPPLSLGFGAGKLVPTDGLTDIREFVVGQRVEGLVLPEGFGGTAPLTYSLSPALPAGLTFDAITRTIAGTPTAASETVYTYTITDANGASLSLVFQTRPAAFSLADNFPNPFNPATTIQYALPQAADVELTVYNVVGQPVRTLVAEHQSAGRYVVEWDATNDSGHSLSSGMYFYRLQAGGEFHEVKKMLLLK